MKKDSLHTFLNLIKVRSIVTFAVVGVFVYEVTVAKELDPATTTAIIMMVFQSLFNKDDKEKRDLESKVKELEDKLNESEEKLLCQKQK